MTLNFWSSCLRLLSAAIVGVCHHAQVYEALRIKPIALCRMPVHSTDLPLLWFTPLSLVTLLIKWLLLTEDAVWSQLVISDAFVIPSVITPFVAVFHIHTCV